MKFNRRSFAAFFPGVLSGCTTPYGVDGSALGGTKAEQLTHDSYSIFATQNGFTPPSALKPSVMRRARKIGIDSGFRSFEIENVILRYYTQGHSYSAIATVRYFSAHQAEQEGRYEVSAADIYRPEFPEKRPASHVVLTSNAHHNAKWGMTLRAVPVFLDAVSGKRESWSHTTVTLLKPGRHHIGLHVWLAPLFVDFLPIVCDLQADRDYEARAEFDDNTLRAFIVEADTGREIAVAPRVKLGRPN